MLIEMPQPALLGSILAMRDQTALLARTTEHCKQWYSEAVVVAALQKLH